MFAASIAMVCVCLGDLTYSGVGSKIESPHVWAYLLGWHLVLGLFTGCLVTLVRPVAFYLEKLLIHRWKTGAGLVFAGLGLGVILGLLLSMWIYREGIEARALPWHVLVPCIVFILPFGVLVRSGERRMSARASAAGVCFFAMCALLMLVGSTRRVVQDESIPALLNHAITGRLAIRQARAAYDDDTDGYPTRFCLHDCDCDDGRRRINPGAIERINNGVDEDCDGGDLRVANMERVFRGTPPAETVSVAAKQSAVVASNDQQNRTNVILIIVDTLRADHLGFMGYHRATSPRLDELARDAAVFTQARAQGSMTRESLAPILTGRYYTQLARNDVKWPTFFEENVFVAEMLRDVGYETWGISSFIYVIPKYGFGQGLSVFDTRIHQLRDKIYWSRTSDLVTDFTLAQVDAWQDGEKPFYIMSHYADPHAGYKSHRESPRFGGYTADLYDEEIYFTDLHLGRLFDGLKERGRLRDTVILLTADHGEGLVREEDHGRLYHGQHLYDNLIHVPLLIWAPGVEGRRIDEPVATIDIVPTILELTGVAVSTPLSGISLVPWMTGQATQPHPPVISQKVQPRNRAKIAMVQWPHKVIWNVSENTWELYDVHTDPNERRNIVGQVDEHYLQKLRRLVKGWRATVGERPAQLSLN